MGHDGDVDGTINAAEIPVESEFSDDESFAEGLGCDLAGDGEDGDCDGEVESGAFFADIGWGEITDEKAVGEGESGVSDSGSDTLGRFLDGFVGESDDEESGLSAAEIDFDNYWEGVDSVKSGGVGLGNHISLRLPRLVTVLLLLASSSGGECSYSENSQRCRLGYGF